MNRKLFLFTCLFCVLATGYGQDQWKWLNPQPSGFYNVKIVFADRLTGFILNTNNDLLKTTDRGGTWTIAGNFRNASCLDIHDSTGVMSGNGGVLYLSTDNGNTWNSLQSGISDQVQFVNVVSRDSFFLSTAAGTIYATGDRGSTWSTRNSHTNISCITFLNSMTGFIGSNTSAILRTKDGGVSWHTVDSVNYFPANILSIQFLNVDTGYAFREYDSLLWTYDGGNTWSGANVNAYQSMYAVNFVNRSLGFLAGEDGALYRSADGGATWSPVMPANSFLYGYDLSSIAFTSPDTGFVVGALGRILRTTDSGQTWNSYSPAYSPIYSAVFGSPSTGYAANGSYILKTTDSGQTWNRLGLTTGLSYGSYSVFRHAHFTSADTGYVVSDQYVTVHKTNDGGQTWQSINPEPSSYSDLLGESYLNPQTGILSLGTALAETQDGGNSWSQLWTAQYQGQSFSNIFFLDNNIAFATNGSGALYKTTNAFQSWTQVFTNPLGYTITGVWFLDANKGFITDDETQIFVTNDGGNSWQPVSFAESFIWDTFNSVIKFFSPQVGYITNGNTFGPGSVGRIYKTVDGGQTWQLSYKAGGATIEFTTDSNVLVSGYGGAILRCPIKGWQVDSLFVLGISSCHVTLSASMGAALGNIDSIRFQVTAPDGTVNLVKASPDQVSDNRVTCTAALSDLKASGLYTVRAIFRFNGVTAASDTVQFIAQGIPQPYLYDSSGVLVSTSPVGNQWYLNGNAIAGATNQRLITGTSGVYTVQVRADSCSSPMSQPYKFYANDLGVILAPNPAHDYLSLLNTQNRILKLRILDMQGRTLFSGNYSSPIDVSSLSRGEYIINLQDATSNQTANIPFVKF